MGRECRAHGVTNELLGRALVEMHPRMIMESE
jgi:hypothetical protein